MQDGMQGNPTAGTMKKFSRALAFLSVPFTMNFAQVHSDTSIIELMIKNRCTMNVCSDVASSFTYFSNKQLSLLIIAFRVGIALLWVEKKGACRGNGLSLLRPAILKE